MLISLRPNAPFPARILENSKFLFFCTREIANPAISCPLLSAIFPENKRQIPISLSCKACIYDLSHCFTLFHPATTTITSVLLLFSVVLFPFIFFSLLYFSLWYYFKRYAGFLFFNSHFFFENCHFSFLANQAGI